MSYNVVNKQTGEVTQVAGVASGGLTPEEHGWLESLASYTHNMYDINPTQSKDLTDATCLAIYATSMSSHWQYPSYNKLPVCGYKRIKIWTHSSYYTSVKYRFQLIDGSFTTAFDATSEWSDWIDIPENAVCIQESVTSSSALTTYFSLSTSDS